MTKRRVLAGVVVALVAGAGIAWLAWPAPVRIEVATATRGPLRVTVEGPGKVRVRDRFVVAAPVSGEIAVGWLLLRNLPKESIPTGRTLILMET